MTNGEAVSQPEPQILHLDSHFFTSNWKQAPLLPSLKSLTKEDRCLTRLNDPVVFTKTLLWLFITAIPPSRFMILWVLELSQSRLTASFPLPCCLDVECSADPCLCAHLWPHRLSARYTLRNQDHVSRGLFCSFMPPLLLHSGLFRKSRTGKMSRVTSILFRGVMPSGKT